MQQEELDVILKQKPILGILIRGVYDGKLEAITHIAPEQASETYKRYCKSIDLGYVPHLFVVDDAVGMPKGVTDAAGLFIRVPAAQGILLLKSVYDGFLEDQNLANYMTAHELGHAKFSAMHSRRFVLQQLAGLSALAGTAYGTKRATDFLADSTLPAPENSEKNAVRQHIGWVPGVAMGVFIKGIVDEAFMRTEEFAADALGSKAVPKIDMVIALGTQLEKGLEENGQRDFLGKLREQYLQEVHQKEQARGAVFSKSAVEYGWATALAKATIQPIPKRSLILPTHYPTQVERIERLRELIEQEQSMKR